MADRISVDIEGLRDSLEKLADFEERTLSAQARYLIKEAINARPFIPKSGCEEASRFLEALASGEKPTNSEILELAPILGISEEKLMIIRDRLFPNGQSEEVSSGNH